MEIQVYSSMTTGPKLPTGRVGMKSLYMWKGWERNFCALSLLLGDTHLWDSSILIIKARPTVG